MTATPKPDRTDDVPWAARAPAPCKLDARSLSPDPLYGRDADGVENGWRLLALPPHAVAWSGAGRVPLEQAAWAGPVTLGPDGAGEVELVLDFGTEVEAGLELELEIRAPASVAVTFGENLWEAREFGLATTCAGQRPRKQHWHLPEAGRHRRVFEEGGFRFARLWFAECRAPVIVQSCAARARLWFGERRGDFDCANRRLQRIWQAAAYTARLCSRPDAYWDGIKRDRHGWYGDARITQLATDAVFLEPGPAIGMLLNLSGDAWANGIPNFSFDAVAMLKQVLLAHGTGVENLRDAYDRVAALVEWALRSQSGEDGLLTRRDDAAYFFDIGFTDWSPQPLGGRFEDLACLQFAWLECLGNAAQIAAWMGDEVRARDWGKRAARLRPLLRGRFAAADGGFHHTLNLAEPRATPWRMPLAPGVHYRKSYREGAAFGPSGPSLHSGARAWFAGLVGAEDAASLLSSTFRNPALPAIVTGFYQYYTLMARAGCGDAAGAFASLEQYFGDMLERHDSPTIWEHYEPAVTGMERWSLGAWPRSQCHGWSSGAVPLCQRYLLGIASLAPGFARVRLDPAPLPWPFRASVPTPRGEIVCRRDEEGGPVRVTAPPGVAIEPAEAARA